MGNPVCCVCGVPAGNMVGVHVVCSCCLERVRGGDIYIDSLDRDAKPCCGGCGRVVKPSYRFEIRAWWAQRALRENEIRTASVRHEVDALASEAEMLRAIIKEGPHG